ncbi:hypothetical protein PoB_003278000 [Plakobranchus ocellatus]|uniref:Uncharacterized protein n=1 Tax=Plakobranchus ocellatus TaxID=259542 RepID=A0AAV4AFW8_9GAST|nr:hypothetical protein PoB_003278000 [Plakobranchus ocellatus]
MTTPVLTLPPSQERTIGSNDKIVVREFLASWIGPLLTKVYLPHKALTLASWQSISLQVQIERFLAASAEQGGLRFSSSLSGQGTSGGAQTSGGFAIR